MPQGGHGGHYPGIPGGKRDKNPPTNFGQPGPYGHGQGGGGMGMGGGAASATGWTQPGGGRASMEMPNIQALGLSNNQGGQQSGNNPMASMGLNNIALPMNPALVAAALNQAGWGLIGNLQSAGPSGPPSAQQGAEQQQHPGPFPTPTSFSTPGGNVTSTTTSGGMLTGWGQPAAAQSTEGMPAATPPGGTVTTPQHQWPSQQSKRDGGGSWKYGDM